MNEEETHKLELSSLDAKALRFAIDVVKSLVFEGKLELHDYQAKSLESVKDDLDGMF